VFERFTHQARQVVVSAQEEARRTGDPFVDCTHLLVGLTMAGGPGGAALDAAGIGTGAVRAALEEVVRHPLDGDALATLGIDLGPVRAAAESAFGAGALDRPPRPRVRRRATGHMPVTARVRTALERSLRAAVASGDRSIDTRHLLIGVLEAGEPRATAVLRRLGTDPGALLRQAGGDAAA
jgi:ATP-dependent Clp protease ATP-binding subunit ClpA